MQQACRFPRQASRLFSQLAQNAGIEHGLNQSAHRKEGKQGKPQSGVAHHGHEGCTQGKVDYGSQQDGHQHLARGDEAHKKAVEEEGCTATGWNEHGKEQIWLGSLYDCSIIGEQRQEGRTARL